MHPVLVLLSHAHPPQPSRDSLDHGPGVLRHEALRERVRERKKDVTNPNNDLRHSYPLRFHEFCGSCPATNVVEHTTGLEGFLSDGESLGTILLEECMSDISLDGIAQIQLASAMASCIAVVAPAPPAGPIYSYKIAAVK